MLTPVRILCLAVGLVATAPSLFGCSHHASDQQKLIVTAANSAEIQTEMASDTHISRADRIRFAAFIAAHRRSPNAYIGHTVAEIVALQKAYETGQKLIAADRAKVAARRALMARTFTLLPVAISDDTAHVIFTFLAHNFTPEKITHITFGLSIFDRTTGKRIGLTEWTIDRTFAPKSVERFTQALPYLHFAEDSGTMRQGAHTARRVVVDVEAVTFADGGKAGEDD